MIITAEIISRKYAIAFSRVNRKIFNETLIDQVRVFADFLKNQRAFTAYLSIPSITLHTKITLIEKILHHFSLGSEFKDLIVLLLKHKRIDFLQPITMHIIDEYFKVQSIAPFSIYSSHLLHNDEKQHIINFIKQEIPSQTIQAKFYCSPELISGVRIKSDRFLWERSIRKTLRTVKQTMLQRMGL